MAGIYTDVEIEAPNSAAKGERVTVSVRVENIDPEWDHLISCKASSDGVLFIDEAVNIYSLTAYVFTGYFTMPSKDVTISADTYYPRDTEWILDDEAQKDVTLKAAPPVGCLPLVILGLAILAAIAIAVVGW